MLHWICPNQMDSGQILSQHVIAYRGVSKSLGASSYAIPQHSFFKDNDLGEVLPVAKNVILHVMMGNEF
ncbi:hypothetical protein TL18_00565 [Methanobrevibacter sp. YE315]|uniref:hypothetical protein n=1 Tax=Methanobrevibacter sp. YE315 TaxID=1609968 RepID=UPI000764ED19|nr:hypothetical protein [Methanobrevibacter sp. YE315]AMD16659.1 hypothetical protein TL18_00565 [Methanobrevibacter sp. YE315]